MISSHSFLSRVCTLALLALVALVSAPLLHAATDTFQISTFIDGDDFVPPSIPGSVSAIPVALTQIDLSWASSSDNVLMGGYQVFRDGLQVATTTSTTFSDVGLIASTSYAYYVTAYDYKGNISASSTVVSTSTLGAVVPSVDEPSGAKYGSLKRLPLELVRLELVPEQTSVTVRFDTGSHTRSVIRWGKTTSYELGSIAERSHTLHHETRIVGLEPGTVYYIRIEGETAQGTVGVLTEKTFTTVPPDDITPPSNVTDLAFTREGNDIVLTWVNPGDEDFSHVRVMRNTQFYPGDTADGWVVYEDTGARARDEGVALPGAKLFYTVFAIDKKGNTSSGAVIVAQVAEDGSVLPPIIIATTTNPLELSLGDILVMQDGERIVPVGGRITIDGAKRLSIAIPYDRLPEHLKTILVSIASPDSASRRFEFLLRVNRDKTHYVAEVAPFGVSATFPFHIAIFDFTTMQIGYTAGTLVSEIATYGAAVGRGESTDRFARLLTMTTTSYLILFTLTLLALTLIARRFIQVRVRE